MRYENRQPAEGINVTRVHPLSQFMHLAIGALVLVVMLVMALQVSGAWLAKRIPFNFELSVMEELDVEFGDKSAYPQMTAYLNDLAMRMSQHMDLPEGMQITVHYSDQDTFNAFATVGGNLLFYKGLLDAMPDENTLAMVMAHEIAHVLHRDPVASMGGGVASSLALLALTGGSDMAGSVLSVGAVTRMRFTRSMETLADESALAALHRVYGHLNGAQSLFTIFSQVRGSQGRSAEILEGFLSTHPRDQDRINLVRELADAEGWLLQGEPTSLPEDFQRWL